MACDSIKFSDIYIARMLLKWHALYSASAATSCCHVLDNGRLCIVCVSIPNKQSFKLNSRYKTITCSALLWQWQWQHVLLHACLDGCCRECCAVLCSPLHQLHPPPLMQPIWTAWSMNALVLLLLAQHSAMRCSGQVCVFNTGMSRQCSSSLRQECFGWQQACQ
jgi:hypothetical protein